MLVETLVLHQIMDLLMFNDKKIPYAPQVEEL